MTKIKAGIAGGAGYTGGELLRILVFHPNVEIAYVHSTSNAGNLVSDVHTDLLGVTDIKFTDQLSDNVDVIFLCVGHGDAAKFIEVHADYFKRNSKLRIIDLSQDFRLDDKNKTYNLAVPSTSFVYGMAELQRDKIKKAQYIANPGCFATCIQLALYPLANKSLLNNEVHISAITGSTGAGQSLSRTSHFSWRNNNMSVYKAFNHQHLNEIGQNLRVLQKGFDKRISFIPYRGDFPRGIIASVYTTFNGTLEEAVKIYQDFYKDHPFTHVSLVNPDLKQVVNTNNTIVYLEKWEDQLLIISIMDNLLKGASGQAVQNMNLMFGLDETTGIRLKANAF